MSLQDKIAALNAKRPTYRNLDPRGLELLQAESEWAHEALALAREWIERPRHLPGCENKAFPALLCRECEEKVLAALELPKLPRW